MQVHYFYIGLSHPTRTLIHTSTGGAITGKNEVEAYKNLENIALNDCKWPVERAAPKKPNCLLKCLHSLRNYKPLNN